MYAAGAGAQLTGTVSVVSDYRFRGVSLSQQKPAAQASIGYDDPSGWYGGVFGSTVELAGESATTGQAVAYLGVVTPIGGGFHWDVGADYSAFSDSRDYDYGEVYTGITSSNFNARIHYSPNYFGFARGFVLWRNERHPSARRRIRAARAHRGPDARRSRRRPVHEHGAKSGRCARRTCLRNRRASTFRSPGWGPTVPGACIRSMARSAATRWSRACRGRSDRRLDQGEEIQPHKWRAAAKCHQIARKAKRSVSRAWRRASRAF